MVVVQVPPTASPGDTVQYNINGQLMNVVIPDGLLGRAEPRNKNAPPLHEAVRGQVRLVIVAVLHRVDQRTPARRAAEQVLHYLAGPATRKPVHKGHTSSCPTASPTDSKSARGPLPFEPPLADLRWRHVCSFLGRGKF